MYVLMMIDSSANLSNSKQELQGNSKMAESNKLLPRPLDTSLLHVHLVLHKQTSNTTNSEKESQDKKDRLDQTFIQSAFLLLGTCEDMLQNPSFPISIPENQDLDSCSIFINQKDSSSNSKDGIKNWSSCLVLMDQNHFLTKRSIELVHSNDADLIAQVRLEIVNFEKSKLEESGLSFISQKQLLLLFPLTIKSKEFVDNINEIPLFSVDAMDQIPTRNQDYSYDPLSSFYIKSRSLLIPSINPSISQHLESNPNPPSLNSEVCNRHESLNPFISPRQELIKSPKTKPNYIASELSKSQSSFCSYEESCGVFCMTWNVAGLDVQPDLDISPSLSFTKEVKNDGQDAKNSGLPTICIFGFQEIDTRNEAYLYLDSTRNQYWQTVCYNSLKKTTGGVEYVPLGSGKQLVGLLVLVFVKKEDANRVGDVAVSSLATGLLGIMGNKGAVVCRFKIDNTFVTAVVCHFAADVDMIQRRNVEFNQCMYRLTTAIPSSFQSHSEIGVVQEYIYSFPWIFGSQQLENNPEIPLSDEIPIWLTDYLFFLGDLNYRSILTRPELIDLLPIHGRQGNLQKALESDQLERERKSGRVFVGFKEAPIEFLPTYKYDIGTNEYDTSEKMRCPAWCDRILWRDQGDSITNLSYSSGMHQMESDHKPVLALFSIKLRKIDTESLEKRQVKLLRQLDVFENEATPTIELSESTVIFGAVRYPQPKIKHVMVVNRGRVWSRVACSISSPENEWLHVTPSTCFLFPGESIYLTIEVRIPSWMVPALNRAKTKLEGFIVFNVEDGRDVFCSVECKWIPQSLGESLFVLCHLPDLAISSILPTRFLEIDELIRKGLSISVSIPRQISRLVDFIYQYGKAVPDLFSKNGDPFVVEYLLDCIENNVLFDLGHLFLEYKKVLIKSESKSVKDVAFEVAEESTDLKLKSIGKMSMISHGQNEAVHACISLLLLFLKSLPSPIIPINSQDRCINEGYLSSIAAKQVVSQTFKKQELIFFNYLVLFLKDFIRDYNEKSTFKIDKDQLYKILVPIFFNEDLVKIKAQKQSNQNSANSQLPSINQGRSSPNPSSQGYFSYFSFSESILGYTDSSKKILFLSNFFE